MQNIAGAGSRTGIKPISRAEIGPRWLRRMRDPVFCKTKAAGLPSIFPAEAAGGRAVAIAGKGCA